MIRDLALYKESLIIYNTILGLSLKMALKEDPKHVAVKIDLTNFNCNYSKKIMLHLQLYIQGVPGGMDKTSGGCSLC